LRETTECRGSPRDSITPFAERSDAYDTDRFVDILPELRKAYNRTPNKLLGVAPEEVGSKYPEELVLLQNRIRRENAVEEMRRRGVILAKGDRVRVRVEKGPFGKGSVARFGKEVHVIARRRGTRYFLEDDAEKRPYNYTELQLVHEVAQNPFKGQETQGRERKTRTEKQRDRAQKRANRDLADFLQAPAPEVLPERRERRPSRRAVEGQESR
jgi:hypothetical protein